MLQNLPTDVSLNLLEENFKPIVKMFKPTTVRACDEYFTIVFAVVYLVRSMANIQGLELQGKIGLSKKSD